VSSSERGFVFVDDASVPYLVRRLGGEPWLCYWHADRHWVTLRKLTQEEVARFGSRALPAHQAELYHELQRRWEGGEW
jgi:hypothetical protein